MRGKKSLTWSIYNRIGETFYHWKCISVLFEPFFLSHHVGGIHHICLETYVKTVRNHLCPIFLASILSQSYFESRGKLLIKWFIVTGLYGRFQLRNSFSQFLHDNICKLYFERCDHVTVANKNHVHVAVLAFIVKSNVSINCGKWQQFIYNTKLRFYHLS